MTIDQIIKIWVKSSFDYGGEPINLLGDWFRMIYVENQGMAFGTTLGSFTSIIPKKVWQMPWGYGQYEFDYEFHNGNYDKYILKFKSKQGNGIVNIRNTKDLSVFGILHYTKIIFL